MKRSRSRSEGEGFHHGVSRGGGRGGRGRMVSRGDNRGEGNKNDYHRNKSGGFHDQRQNGGQKTYSPPIYKDDYRSAFDDKKSDTSQGDDFGKRRGFNQRS